MSANVLFYSNNCDGSKALITLMDAENLTKYFHLVCTDNNRKNIPREITLTPTLIIKGISHPYVAGDAFVWLSKVKQWKIQIMMQRVADNQKQYLQGNIGTADLKLLGFNKAEMEGMSDMFAFITEDNIPHAHFNYNDLGNEIFCVTVRKEDMQKIDANAQLKLTKNLEAERTKQDNMIKKEIDNLKNHYKK